MNKYEKALDGLKEQIENATGMKIESDEQFYEWVESLQKLIDYYAVLEDAITISCNRIEFENNGGKMDEGPKCPAISYAFMPQCCNENFCDGSNAECWKEWCMHMAKQKNKRNGENQNE